MWIEERVVPEFADAFRARRIQLPVPTEVRSDVLSGLDFFLFFGVVASTGCAGSFTLLDRIVHLEEMLYALAVSTALCGTPRTGVA